MILAAAIGRTNGHHHAHPGIVPPARDDEAGLVAAGRVDRLDQHGDRGFRALVADHRRRVKRRPLLPKLRRQGVELRVQPHDHATAFLLDGGYEAVREVLHVSTGQKPGAAGVPPKSLP